MELQKQPLKNVSVATRETSKTPNTEIALSYQNIYGISNEWSIVTKVLSKTQLDFRKLCISEKFYIIKLLNDPNLLNKKFELVNVCHHLRVRLHETRSELNP